MLLYTLLLAALLTKIYAVDPLVDVSYAQYEGTALSNGITQWLGMRYAAAPVGDLRFAPPQDPPALGEVAADTHGLLCLSTGASPTANTTSEDCLFLDVYAPSSATPSSPLPVYFFIQGGGFNSDSNANYNGSGLIAASNNSIVVVNFNYRVGPYGFIASSEILNSSSASVNNGLRDQLKALQWVQSHISSFGGDPKQVTIGGDSAGAASITLLLTAHSGNILSTTPEPLFHAAAAESQSFATVLTVAESEYQYDNLVIRTGCASSSDTLSCLRSLSAAELQLQNTNSPYPGAISPPLYMWGPVIDNDIITDYTYRAFANGHFAKVPVIFGDDTNGGTVFTPQNTSSIGQSNTFLKDQFPYLTLTQLARLNELYPNVGPYFNGTGSYWRQVSNVYGEMRYMCPGLFISSAYSQYADPAQSWNYLYNVQDPVLEESGLGVPHTIEVNAIWGPDNVNGGAPSSYQSNGTNAWIVPLMQGYWTSFVRTGNPNTYRMEGAPVWESWTGAAGRGASKNANWSGNGSADGGEGWNRLAFNTETTTGMESVDVGLRGRCEYLWEIGVSVRQ